LRRAKPCHPVLIRDGGVDLLRLHTSAVGGPTPTRKLVALAERMCG
jgi:mannonate dehydratase